MRPTALAALWLLYWTATVAQGLTIVERNELSRKFKYYFRSVRPVGTENIVSNRNGTFFSIKTSVHVMESTPIAPTSLIYTVYLSMTYSDDRLILRELTDRFEVPLTEFDPWRPRMSFSPPPDHPVEPSLFLAPNTGKITIFYKLKSTLGCTSRSWKHPFETLTCTLRFDNMGDELISISDHRDLRSESDVDNVAFEITDLPSPLILFSYSPSWLPTLVSIYLPSAIIFAVVFFAQWKRRKVQANEWNNKMHKLQVAVTVTALICLMILFSRRDDTKAVNLLDLWLCSTFMHTVLLLVIDLTLPSRRIRYTLMLDVDGNGEYRRVPSVDRGASTSLDREMSSPSPRTSFSQARTAEKYSPILGGQRAFLAVQKYAVKRFGTNSVETKLVNEKSDAPIHRHIQTSSIGLRKRVALAVVLSSYLLFCLIYFFIIASID
ncbi:lgc-33 [Pristionchus pacificus]|uniref:Lgc-33 n=1 Tax=Pristionchus pacificus TaxID=54126 RepID=A0A2A6BYA6_PRIPA|nr:lgc-33 [Pristionchus pacificus]|eukprot:PDM70849.1 lgc-33 [Pristionchus pacificus]